MTDQRDKIWDVCWLAYYECYYSESAAVFMVSRLQAVDAVQKVLVAVFSSTSAIAGWTLWKQKGFEWMWPSLAAIAAVLSIVHAALNISKRLELFSESKVVFLRLRIAFELLLDKMRLNPDFESELCAKETERLKTQYGQALEKWPQDIFFLRRDQERVQCALDEKLGTK